MIKKNLTKDELMKIFTCCAISFLFMQTAMACPILAGQWNCRNSDGSTSVASATQSYIPGGVHYRLTGDGGETTDYLADGVVYPFEHEGFYGTMVTTCTTGDVVSSKTEMRNDEMGMYSTSSLEITMTTGHELVAKN